MSLEDSEAKALVNLHFWNFCLFFSTEDHGFKTQSLRCRQWLTTPLSTAREGGLTPSFQTHVTTCESQFLFLLILADKRIKIIIRSARTRQQIKESQEFRDWG